MKLRYGLAVLGSSLALYAGPAYSGDVAEEVGNRGKAIGNMAISGVASPYMLAKEVDKKSRNEGLLGLIESPFTFTTKFVGKVAEETTNLFDGESTKKLPYELD